ncbi:hypothetical protein XELAEV_18044924mg [Xenopus laevis]|uniref:Uncharacterized protein n=1 Tax=Xenopus laevis TaxID=8355 RepID=A0A974C0B1_XENLA|nr:hypothetical protein XELAEV_18044924mg [Xenopus laevis]
MGDSIGPIYQVPRAVRSARKLLLHSVAEVVSMCAGVSSVPGPPAIYRLSAVPGCVATKSNDVLLCPARESSQKPQHVLYFPGDVQSSQMHLHKFSCYDNFVESNMFGAPKHSTELGAFNQLQSLLTNAFSAAQTILLSQNNKYSVDRDYDLSKFDICTYTTNGCPSKKDNLIHSTMNLGLPSLKDSLSITVIGFSKGCVVLNQLLYELQEAIKDKDIQPFLANIKAMYWLDGGHSGGFDTWITYPDLLKAFAQTGIAVHMHVTPYQVRDVMRSWIGEEHRKFVQLLKQYNVKVDNRLHFSYEMPSLENHFRVHEVF